MNAPFTIITALCFSLIATAQTAQQNKAGGRPAKPIDTIVQNAAIGFMKDTARVGLSIGVYKQGRMYIYHYGSTKKGKDARPANNTIYEIGSITKTFTGTLLAQALLDKKLRLEDDIRKYLPGSYPNLEYHGQPVRIAHLVNHTAGLPSFLPDRPDIFQHPQDSIPLLLAALHKNYTKEKFFKDLHNIQLDTVPGFNYKYSNAGAQLAGFILEKVYNSSYRELVRKFILAPLKMNNTDVMVEKDKVAFLARGHSSSGKTMPSISALSISQPAGGIYSTIPDMLQYIKFHLQEKNPLVQLSHQPTYGDTSDFGIGLYWRVNRTSDGKLKVWHTGGTFGFSSYCVLYPEFDMGIILLSNEFDMTSQGELVAAAEHIFNGVCREQAPR
jgi:CubicO group peptidase (beta-lactamase class C family)